MNNLMWLSCKPRRRPMDKLIWWFKVSCPIVWVRIQSAWFTDDLLKWLWVTGSKIAPQRAIICSNYCQVPFCTHNILCQYTWPLQSHFPCSSCTFIPFPHWIKNNDRNRALCESAKVPQPPSSVRMINPWLLQYVRNTSNIGDLQIDVRHTGRRKHSQ